MHFRTLAQENKSPSVYHLFTLLFTFLFLSLFSMYDSDLDSVTNNLRDFVKRTFVTLDDYLPLTGYEPNAMELTNATELNDAVSSDINFQDSLDYTAPSSDLYMYDDALGKLLAEVHRDYADYRRPGRCKCQPVVNVSHGRSNGGTCGKGVISITLVLVPETCRVLKISFLQSLKLKEWSIER